MKAALILILFASCALSAQAQRGPWHSLSSAPDEYAHAWMSSNGSRIAAESINGYFIIIATTTGEVVRQTACIQRPLTRELVNGGTWTARPSITGDTALVIVNDGIGSSAAQHLSMVELQTGATIRSIDLTSQLPDSSRGWFTHLQWDHSTGIVTLGLRTNLSSVAYYSEYFRLDLDGNELLERLPIINESAYAIGSEIWVHPFVVDPLAYPASYAPFTRDSTYLVFSDTGRAIVVEPPSTTPRWSVDEIPLALVDSVVITLNVDLQQTTHRRLRDGTVIRSHQHVDSIFWPSAALPSQIISLRSQSQRYIKTSSWIVDLVEGVAYPSESTAAITLTNDGDVISTGDPHGRPLHYALRRTGYVLTAPPQFIGTPLTVIELPTSDELFYSTSAFCRTHGSSIAGGVGTIRRNTVSAGLELSDGTDINDVHLDGFDLYVVPTAAASQPPMIAVSPREHPGHPGPYRHTVIDATSMQEQRALFSHSRVYLDPLREIYYSVDTRKGLVESFTVSDQPEQDHICSDTIGLPGYAVPHILKGTGQLVNGSHLYDGVDCRLDSIEAGVAVTVGTVRPLALIADEGEILLFDLSVRPPLERWRVTIPERLDATFANRDHVIRCVDRSGRLQTIAVSDGAIETTSLPAWPDSVLRIHWSSDGSLITAEPGGNGLITTWDQHGTLLRQLSYPDPFERRVQVTSESAVVFITSSGMSGSSGYATWWSDGLTVPTTGLRDHSYVDSADAPTYPVRVYTTIGQFVGTLTSEADAIALRPGLYILTTASGRTQLRSVR